VGALSEQMDTAAMEDALRDLAGALVTPDVDATMLNRVQAAIVSVPVPSTSPVNAAFDAAWLWLKARMKWLVALVAAVLLTGITVSPVGAEVVEWFGFHGVFVVERAGAPTGEPTVPPVQGELTLDEAGKQAGFEPKVPSLLGMPDDVDADSQREVVSMSWGSHAAAIRLDQFNADLSPLFWKSTKRAELVQLDAGEGLWFPVPHEVVVLGPDGEVTVPARLAGTTLIWPQDGQTLRIEGAFTRTEAIQIANSVS